MTESKLEILIRMRFYNQELWMRGLDTGHLGRCGVVLTRETWLESKTELDTGYRSTFLKTVQKGYGGTAEMC